MSLYNHLVKYVAEFVEGASETLSGMVAIDADSLKLTGTDTNFSADLTEGDQILVWGDNPSNYGASLLIGKIHSDTDADFSTDDVIETETDMAYVKRFNDILQPLLITLDIEYSRHKDQASGEWFDEAVAMRQKCREDRLYPGGWESDSQLSELLADNENLHYRRGTTGENMEDLDDVAPGILGECDRLSKNPGGTIITEGEDLGWVLAGDIEFDLDVSGISSPTATGTNLKYRYPDYTVPDDTAPLGEYSPHELAACWIAVIDMILIQIENLNTDHLEDRNIKSIVRKLIPLDIPTMIQFYED